MAQTAADNTQVTADYAREDMQKHGSETGEAVAQFALQFVGNPYVWGGSSLTHGTDCSGFTMAVYANFGVGLPHYDASQRGYGIGIDSLSDARPGDLICFYGHVGIYIGDGMMVHASNARDGIKVSRADYRAIAAIRRIFYCHFFISFIAFLALKVRACRGRKIRKKASGHLLRQVLFFMYNS